MTHDYVLSIIIQFKHQFIVFSRIHHSFSQVSTSVSQINLIQKHYDHVCVRVVFSLDFSIMNSLLNVCFIDNTSELRRLLQTSSSRKIALAHEERPYNVVRITIPNLVLLFQSAFKVDRAVVVDALLQFAHANNIAYNTLITRDVKMTALNERSLDVLQSYISVMSKTTNLDFEHLNNSLAQSLHKELFDHASFLLDHDANSNTSCAEYKDSDYHLRLAAQKLPLEYTTRLLRHKVIVSQSDAMQMTIEKDDLNVLQALIEHEENVNKRLKSNVSFLSHKRKQQQASETLLHLAIMTEQTDVAMWLLLHDTDIDIANSQNKISLALVKEGENKMIVKMFEKQLNK